LVKHISEAEMQQRRVVVVANLKPAAMRGITSQAMVLAATHPESGKVRGMLCLALCSFWVDSGCFAVR
jgi:tRNA-binding EMAP/Myf-like protein